MLQGIFLFIKYENYAKRQTSWTNYLTTILDIGTITRDVIYGKRSPDDCN